MILRRELFGNPVIAAYFEKKPENGKVIKMERKKKKILFIITQTELGGAQKFLLELAQNLDAQSYDMLVAAGETGSAVSAAVPGILADLEKCSLRTIPLNNLVRTISPFRDIAALFEIRKLLREERPDILFLLSSKAGFIGSLAGKLSGVKRIIYRIGGWAFNDPRSAAGKNVFIIAEKISARWKDVIIVNSQHDAKQAEILGIRPKEKTVVVYNGINAAELDFFSHEESRKRFALDSAQPVVGVIANFYKTKGLECLLDAFADIVKKIPDAKLVIIGGGGENLPLSEQADRLHIAHSVIFAGHIPNAWKYLKAFDLFVLPSLKEGFPWVLLEAMAAEVPIVATAVGAVPEILENGSSGIIVPPGDIQKLSDAIVKLLRNPEIRAKFATQARRAVISRFPKEKMVAEIEQLL
jgi:glycosyltransferase involved in cell wall biosynthesis